MEEDLALLIRHTPCFHNSSCMYLVKPRVGAAGKETIELYICEAKLQLVREINPLLRGGGDRGPHSLGPSLNPS
jgi:hypothetical protein